MHLQPPTSSTSISTSIDSPLPSPAQVGPVDTTYVFVYTSITAEGATRHEPSSHIRIRSASEDTEHDGVYICTAAFQWRAFAADFTCLYDPTTDQFSEFEVVEDSMEGGMEDVEGVDVGFLVVGKDGRGGVEEREVKDERGNRFMVVEFDFGYQGCAEKGGVVYGKRALPGDQLGSVWLTEGERRALGIEDEEWEEAEG